MVRVIEAVYEEGVFKPVTKVRLKERQRVQIRIVSEDDWQKQFDRIIGSIHVKVVDFPPEEIGADIKQAVREVREGRRAR